MELKVTNPRPAAQESELQSAELLAIHGLVEAHREITAYLPAESPTRARMLRQAARWSTIAGHRSCALRLVGGEK